MTAGKYGSTPFLYLIFVGKSGRGGGQGRGGSDDSKFNSVNNMTETMRQRASAIFVFSFISVFLCVSFSMYSSRNSIYTTPVLYTYNIIPSNNAIQETLDLNQTHPQPPVSSLQPSIFIPSVSVLFPAWEVLVTVSPEFDIHDHNLTCLYHNLATSPAIFFGMLNSTNHHMFKCWFPRSSRRRLPFLSPVLTQLSSDNALPVPLPPMEMEMLRWNRLVYESFSTRDDVVLFAKGINNRQGINRSPDNFMCVFMDESNNTDTVKTTVTCSTQEVFRCDHPDLTVFTFGTEQQEGPVKLKVSLEISEDKSVFPTAAYYTPWRKVKNTETKYQLCATTMVYNVGKFLREWVMYHSKIGVEKFILYDNGSDDDLTSVVEELNQQGYKVETLLWIWPKTQEAGFSHAALHAQDSCEWMMYIDVDEFVFSPSWENSSLSSDQMLKSLLPSSLPSSSSSRMIGEVSIRCNEFGPSRQNSNPVEGVTQGYNCRRRLENRHKSIVLLEAIDKSLLNVIHHFSVKEGYRVRRLSLERAVVNHYKYQAWSEFKAKFKRRVSTYVVDWMQALNPESKDRTPGLGYEAIEPPGWENKFCEVWDDGLKLLTRKWFGRETETGYMMAWQS